jgi:hypothetical protein
VVAGGRREGGGGRLDRGADGCEGREGGREGEEREIGNLALYHVGNPNKGLGDVLIEWVSWA